MLARKRSREVEVIDLDTPSLGDFYEETKRLVRDLKDKLQVNEMEKLYRCKITK